MEDPRPAIERVVQEFMDAFERGDAAAVASLYVGDAKLMPPNQPRLEGAEAIRSFWQGAMDAGVREARIEIEDVEAQGEVAIEVGKYTLTIEQSNGERVSDRGKYVAIWKRRGGEWRLAVDIFNSDMPAPAR
jgi:uncharacterized protein (TIGR02246 family)